MKMETVVLSVNGRDVPLVNLDWVGAMGNETIIVELYDTLLNKKESDFESFEEIKKKDQDLPEYSSGEHWYDSLLLSCSYHKKGKKLTERFNTAAEAYAKEYVRLLKQADKCDTEEKLAKTRSFATTLLNSGGPAVDQIKKLFGEETASRLLLKHMYGVER